MEQPARSLPHLRKMNKSPLLYERERVERRSRRGRIALNDQNATLSIALKTGGCAGPRRFTAPAHESR